MNTNCRAFLIYGLIGGPFPYGWGYSLGLDQLCDRLRAIGIHATTHVEGVLIPYTNVPFLTAKAREAARAGNRILLIGHSMGADAAAKIACRLEAENTPVELLIGLDPTKFGCPDVPSNVKRALCFFQKEELLGRGNFHGSNNFRGQLTNERVLVGHKEMDDSLEVRERIVAEARKLLP
jgi:pimeloyl-ACP methyl ester carboxylesterase